MITSMRVLGLGLLLAVSAAVPDGAFAQVQGADPGCALCHGELELLRQRVSTLEEARALLVPLAALRTSAHDTMSCGSCHSGFERFPHPSDRGETRSCASCHQDQQAHWLSGVHAQEAPEEANCASCHGVHDVLSLDRLREADGVRAMNATCLACHETAALPPTDPHADSVSCGSCHGAHDTSPVDGPASTVAPSAQYGTCGACHEEAAAAARDDAHGQALRRTGIESLAVLKHESPDAPPACTSCHGAHGMLAPSHARFDQDMVGQCGACHADYSRTYFGTYHGKATAVGSEIVATCDHCHGSHGIFPDEDPASMVAPTNLQETCGACHEHVRPDFVLYDSHPDPMNRDRNPPLHYSFVLMNVLLVGVLGVFAVHTALWWVRIMIDRRHGNSHEIGKRTGEHHE